MHPPSFVMSRPSGNADYMLLLVKSDAHFVVGGNIFDVKPGSAILIDKNTPYRYQNLNGKYIDDWIHFLPDDDSAFRSSGLFFNQFFPLPDTERVSKYIQLILFENAYSDLSFRKENVLYLMNSLFNNLRWFQNKSEDASIYFLHSEKLKNIRLEITHSPHENYSVSDCAKKAGLSVSRFMHLYAELFNISFRQDLIAMRIEYAKIILATTDLPVETVALQCGYNSFVHFYRQFKKICGQTPNQYRKQNLLGF